MPLNSLESPFTRYQAYLREGVLAYQWDTLGEQAVFYPRLAAPGTGAPLEWRVSSGAGTVHATTFVPRKDECSYNVAIIEMAEGFRLMSRVEDMPAEDVAVGMPVVFRVGTAEDGTLIPVFAPQEAVS